MRRHGLRQAALSNILLLGMVCLICFIVLEAVIRIFDYSSSGYGYPYDLYVPDVTKGYAYKPNFSGTFIGRGYCDIPIKINSKGLRDYEHMYTGNSTIKVLGLGDSTTFGSGVLFEDTYLSILEERLLQDNYSVEIIKAGVNSYEFDQEYAYYFEEGYRYDPDIVIIGLVLNDIRPIDPLKVKEERFCSERKTMLSKIGCIVGRYSHAANLIARSIRSFNIPYKSYNDRYYDSVMALWKNETAVEHYANKLVELNNHLKREGKKLVLVVFPYTEQYRGPEEEYPQKLIQSTGVKEDFSVIDLMHYIPRENYTEYYLPGDQLHYNRKGNELAAGAIYQALQGFPLQAMRDQIFDDETILLNTEKY